MKILVDFPEGCTQAHINRILEKLSKFNKTLDYVYSEIIDIKIISDNYCAICKTNTKNPLLVMTITIQTPNNTPASMWTPASCLDIESCKYRESVQSEDT